MSGLPTVSVVIPTYERRYNVGRAVASVLAQTYRSFELIVVDDGSSDGTAQALAGVDLRLRYHWQENQGVSAARNTGLRLARGEIIAFLDSDDYWLPRHLAVVTEVLVRNPEVVLVSTCPRFQIGGRQRPADATVFDALPGTLTENIVGYQSCVAVRRADLLAVGGFDERLSVMEGSELWPRLAARGPFATLQRRTVVRQATRGSQVAQFTFLCFGTLRPDKRIDLVLDAFGSIDDPDIALVVAGKVEDPRPLRRVLAAVADGRVRPLLERVPDERVRELFAAVDAAVLGRSEVWTSGSLILALSMGVPAVAAALPLYQELLGSGEAGWFFRPGDVESLRDTLQEAAADPALARAKGAAALKRAQALPSWSEIAKRTAALMLEPANGTPIPRRTLRTR